MSLFFKQQEVFHPTATLDIGMPLAFVTAEIKDVLQYIAVASFKFLQHHALGTFLIAKQR